MATYTGTGRRAPNVSQYVANLNAIPAAGDMARQEFSGELDDDLALFTNTQFFDFDMSETMTEFPNSMNRGMTYTPQSHYGFGFPSGPASDRSGGSLPPSPPNGLPGAYAAQQSQPTIPSPSHFQQAMQHTFVEPQIGEKRNATMASLSSTQDLEEGARYAAEEDKRRRNTAASARFRVKKKQREQALEKTAKEMSEKVQILEARVGQLEMENKWLKGLVMEKNLNKNATKDVSKKSDSSSSESSDENTSEITKKVNNKAAAQIESDSTDTSAQSTQKALETEFKKRGVGTNHAE